jgi:hypothetical protein
VTTPKKISDPLADLRADFALLTDSGQQPQHSLGIRELIEQPNAQIERRANEDE